MPDTQNKDWYPVDGDETDNNDNNITENNSNITITPSDDTEDTAKTKYAKSLGSIVSASIVDCPEYYITQSSTTSSDVVICENPDYKYKSNNLRKAHIIETIK